ncbi:MAG: hypothetical protein J6C96_05755 [Oscillospiraceae bacterium]|nr:hypothetical protein [Oscillospiraceae bacterium]
MSDEKKDKDFFDYDSYVKKSKKKPQKSNNRGKQKPPRFVPADEADKAKKKQEHESIDSIKRMFDEALDESHEELAEFTEEQAVPDMPETNPEGFRRKLYMIFGVFISVLAFIGLISTVSFAVDKIKDFADNTQQKNEFARFIYPIVICDPAPFNQTVKLRSDTMITAALWDIILYEDKSKYEADFDMIIVPEVDVERHCAALFGTGLSVTHQSILGADVQFYYDESIKSYRIPSNPKYFTYSPYIEEITRVGERYTLTVGYVSPTPAWLTLTSDEEPKPDKYVEYVVSKRGNEMTLVAIQESPIKVDSPHGL